MIIKNKALYRKITMAITCGLMFSMSSAVAYAGGEAPKNTATNGVYLYGVDRDKYTYATNRPAGWRLYDETDYQTVAEATKGGLSHSKPLKDDSGSNHELNLLGDGGYFIVTGGVAIDKPAEYNVVTAKDTRVIQLVGGRSINDVARNNTVIITNGGGNVRKVFGGISKNSQNNTVTLGDEADQSGAVNISNDVFINATIKFTATSTGGGTLNIYNSGNKIGGDLHADGANVNFYINPTDMDAEGSKIMLKVGGTADLTGANVKAGVRNVADVDTVADGAQITLLSAKTLKADGLNHETMIVTDGIMNVKLNIENVDNKIIATKATDAPATTMLLMTYSSNDSSVSTNNTNSLNSFKSMSNSFSADNVGRSVSGDDTEYYNVDDEYDSMFLYGVDYKVGSTLTQATQGTKIVAEAVYDSKTNKYKGGLSNNEILAEDSASGHEFTVNGGDFLMVMGGCSSTKNSQNNVVEINGANVYMVCGGYSDQGSANSNKVIISSGLVSDVCGGYSGIGSANDNEVIITSGNVSDVCGGYSDQGSANNNKVIISGGNVGDVCGGYSDQGSANNNKVIISGGEVDNVCGGYSDCGLATGNTVTLGNANSYSGVAKVKDSVVINAVYDNITDMYIKSAGGGTLNVYNSGNEMGGDLYADKANVNFYINAADMNANGSNIMLKVAGTADLTGAKVKAGIRNMGAVESDGKITLLSAEILKANGVSYGTLTDGIVATNLKVENKNIVAAISSTDNTSQHLSDDSPAKSPVETMAANIALLNTGSDMLAGQGMDSASDAIASNEASGGSVSSMAPFACVGGGSLKLKSGSHVDLKSWNFNLGFAKEIKNNSGKLLFGPVIEYGRGNYESHLDNGVTGTGKSSVLGVGMMAKQTFNKGTYVEGSARVGRAKSDYKGALNGQDEVTYDNSTTYYAMHLGVGRKVDLNAADSFDYYGKLFYSHQNGSTANLSNDYDYEFAATNSVRTRLGFRYTHKTNDFSKYYAGLAWQHEFSSSCDADIRNTINGAHYIAPAPGMKGDTGILELGVKLKPNQSDKFEVDLGLAGYTGKQQGITANAQFLFKF